MKSDGICHHYEGMGFPEDPPECGRPATYRATFYKIPLSELAKPGDQVETFEREACELHILALGLGGGAQYVRASLEKIAPSEVEVERDQSDLALRRVALELSELREKMSNRTCIGCKHWYWTSGEPGYSDLTPGSEWESKCLKMVKEPSDPYERCRWYVSGHDTTQEEFRHCLQQAASCPDFEQID